MSTPRPLLDEDAAAYQTLHAALMARDIGPLKKDLRLARRPAQTTGIPLSTPWRKALRAGGLEARLILFPPDPVDEGEAYAPMVSLELRRGQRFARAARLVYARGDLWSLEVETLSGKPILLKYSSGVRSQRLPSRFDEITMRDFLGQLIDRYFATGLPCD